MARIELPVGFALTAGSVARGAQAALAAAGVSRGIWFSFVPTGQPITDPT